MHSLGGHCGRNAKSLHGTPTSCIGLSAWVQVLPPFTIQLPVNAPPAKQQILLST